MCADHLLAHVPLWAQRSSAEVTLAKRQSLELAMRLANHKGDVVDLLTRFALSHCHEARSALTLFQILREAARQGGQRYSSEDISASEECCLSALAKRRPARVHRRMDDTSSDEGGSSEIDSELSGEEVPEKEPSLKVTPQLLADLGVELSLEEASAEIERYPSHLWKDDTHVLPGHHGFNQRATRVLRRAGFCRAQNCSDGLQPHQEIVQFLVHPQSPIQRLLVDHPTGSGKTREMVCILDNFFYDQRPKLAIFPKAAVCRNFYTELLRWPNRYRDYFSSLRPDDAALTAGTSPWQNMRKEIWDLTRLPEKTLRDVTKSMKGILEMKGQSFKGFMRKSFRSQFKAEHPGEPMPLAPLLAISYASAGGSYAALTPDGLTPVSAVMKIRWHRVNSNSCQACGDGDNVLDDKIVLLDETHHLLHPGRYSKQLDSLGACLRTAKRTVAVGFTGTLVLDEASEGQKLLDIIKGGKGTCDEGFLSSFPRPRHCFAEALPRGVPDAELTNLIQEELVHRIQLLGENLNSYDMKIEKGVTGKRLGAYCNVCSFVSSFHDGQRSAKGRILACPEECCSKLWAVAKAVAANKQKALVMTSRSCGYLVILALLRRLARESCPTFEVATMEELAEFNHISNASGQVYRVMVANTNECAEGINFLAVRQVHLTEVPLSHGRFVQICGRAWRMFGHKNLPEEEQTVTYHLYVAALPPWLSSPLAAWAFRAQPRRRYNAGYSTEHWAKELVCKMEARGIHSLEDLQRHLGNFLECHPGEDNLMMKYISEHQMLAKHERSFVMAMKLALENFSPLLVETWDELALHHLTESSKMGLTDLRRKALDAEIVHDLAGYYQCSQGKATRRRLRCKTSPSLATGCRQAPHSSVMDGESKRRIECLYRGEKMGGQDPIRKNKKDARLK